ncbi:MAG: hypothetical protein JKX92_03520 [Porticoccaceae bacterium]|nr:hypothetical protein [Porticoccaceae bacterium]
MVFKKFIFILCILIFIPSCSEAKQKTGPAVTAVEYIVKTHMGSNLSEFSYRAIKVSQTYKIILSKVGDSEGRKLILEKHTETIRKYQHEWDSNLAESYLENMSVKEINSLYYNGKNSIYSEKENKVKRSISASMQSKSTDLLKKVVSESLKSAYDATL